MKRKILVVDDDIDILDSIRDILEMENYIVSTITKGDNIIDIIKSFEPKLILLDLLLSGKDGSDICKNVKSKADMKEIPIIIMSAHPSAKKKASDACADDFLAKPFELDDLLNILNKHLVVSTNLLQ